MTPLEAIVLGIVQGLTEFLPISSTAHLRVLPELLGWKEPGAAFTAVIQWGTFFACVIYFWSDIVRLVRGFIQGLMKLQPLGTTESRLAWLIIVGTLPIVAVGLLFRKQIKSDEMRSLYVVAAAAIGFALLLLAAEVWLRYRLRLGKNMEQLGLWEAIVVGISQAFALVPGASRSGVTITGGLFAGLSRDSAARFSFLLSLPSVFGAGLLELIKDREELLADSESILNLIIATIISGVVGYGSIAFLLGFLRRYSTMVFIVYRLALGAVLIGLVQSGMVSPTPKARTSTAQPPITSSISLNSR